MRPFGGAEFNLQIAPLKSTMNRELRTILRCWKANGFRKHPRRAPAEALLSRCSPLPASPLLTYRAVVELGEEVEALVVDGYRRVSANPAWAGLSECNRLRCGSNRRRHPCPSPICYASETRAPGATYRPDSAGDSASFFAASSCHLRAFSTSCRLLGSGFMARSSDATRRAALERFPVILET